MHTGTNRLALTRLYGFAESIGPGMGFGCQFCGAEGIDESLRHAGGCSYWDVAPLFDGAAGHRHADQMMRPLR